MPTDAELYGSACMGVRAALGLLPPIPPFNRHLTLANGLVSWWPLNETTGTRVDSLAAHNLADINTVFSGHLGPLGRVASFTVANSDFLQSSQAINAFSGDYTMMAWVKWDGVAANPVFFGAHDAFGTGPEAPYLSLSTGSGRWRHVVGNVVTYVDMPADAGQVDGWRLLIGRSSSGIASMWMNNNTTGSGPLAYTMAPGESVITVGADQFTGVEGSFHGGLIGSCAVWTRAISDAEVSFLYNTGKGRVYSDLTPAVKVGLKSWWDLSESVGKRMDSHGHNHLDAFGSVSSAVNTYPANLPGRTALFAAATSERLTATDTDALSLTPRSKTVCAWYNPTTVASFLTVFWKNNEFGLYSNSAAGADFFAINDAAGTFFANVPSGVTANAWNFIVGWYDESDNSTHIQLNNGTAITGQTLTGTEGNTTNVFEIGALNNAVFFDGKISSVGMWNRVLTADERTALYNSGNGLIY